MILPLQTSSEVVTDNVRLTQQQWSQNIFI